MATEDESLEVGRWRNRAEHYKAEAHVLTEERDEAVATVQRLEALVSEIEGLYQVTHIRAAINRYRGEEGDGGRSSV